jgi:hypothetical protein
MNTSESFDALRRANPRWKAGFAQAADAAAEAVHNRLVPSLADARPRMPRVRRRFVGVSLAGLSLAAAAVVAAFLTLGSPGSGPEDATAALRKATTLTAASAERSGTAVVRMTHGGELWAGTTIRWSGEDLAVRADSPDRHGKVGSTTLVVDGMMYGVDPELGRWMELGPPSSIDPDSGTTPAETLAAVREDVGGPTLRRIAGAMASTATQRFEDGGAVYSGRVAAGLIAREEGFKEGQAIRVLPFGYVAHGEAANPSAPLDVAVTLGPEGVVQKLAVTWGSGQSAWSYTVTYSKLGATPAPTAPKNAVSLLDSRRLD